MPNPVIIDAQPSYLVVYKPPQMHSVPLNRTVPLHRPVPLNGATPREQQDPGNVSIPLNQNTPLNYDETLLDWCARLYPEVLTPHGRNPWEGGMLHRLDYETGGLALIARNQAAMDALLLAQEKGRFLKEYAAVAVKAAESVLPGFPSAPVIDFVPKDFSADESIFGSALQSPAVETAFGPLPGSPPFPAIESAFRAYGPGGKAVRPVSMADTAPGSKRRVSAAVYDRGKPYRTEIMHWETFGEYTVFRLRIYRGFRHQIRCHLAWMGYPLLNDALYGGRVCPDYPGLALRAQAISFPDPATGEIREYALAPVSLPEE